MKKVLFHAVPFSKESLTLALESGVDGVVVPSEHVESVSRMARVEVLSEEDARVVALRSKEDESEAAAALSSAKAVILAAGWEIIPVENLLALGRGVLLAEVENAEQARLAAGILERGVDGVVVGAEHVAAARSIVESVRSPERSLELSSAVITGIFPVGLGHRVCVDTLSLLEPGSGMLVGDSAAFTFLVHAETERNEYVASQPFRVNAGAVHSYALMPQDRTAYLEELRSGTEVLIVGADGRASVAVAGRIKVEVRPMLCIRAVASADGVERQGSVFVQNAETIRLVRPGGESASVVGLREGDEILCRLDVAGRHFGMRVEEDIRE